MNTDQTIVVIGAGIVGISCAVWLQRAGSKVIVIDKGKPGHKDGTSYGNGGIIVPSGVAPVTGPGMIAKAPGMLMNPNFPLFLRWGYLPKLLPWLVKYLSHANEADTRRIANGLTVIVGDAVEQHKALAKGTPAEEWIRDADYCFAYANRAAFERDRFVFDLRREAGQVPEVIEGAGVRDYEPEMGSSVDLLAIMKNHGFIRSPGRYVAALAEVFLAEGGDIRQGAVRDIDLVDGRIRAVITDRGVIDCDRAVLATGVWSKVLAEKLGVTVPLESERGYHIVFKNPSLSLRSTYMMTGGKFVVTPMDEGIRCAGIVEFGGLDAPASEAPFKLLRKQMATYFPTLEYSESEEWMGHRPAPSDSLPVIGELGRTGVFAGFGHHHIGLTGGPKTGRLIADLIMQGGSNIDLSPFDPQRFN
ncbi:MAG: FAD-binding oxidoreductase [Rhodobacteraceae bacterium]|nr:FAD-binding oxidoreductase [Paracoccaceae bacterium]